IAIACVVLSLGAHLGPVYALVHRHVPFWSKFRAPIYVMVGTCFAIALLAARGMERILTPGPDDARVPGLRAAAVVLVVATALGLAIGFGPVSSLYAGIARHVRPALAAIDAHAAARWAGIDLMIRGMFVAA